MGPQGFRGSRVVRLRTRFQPAEPRAKGLHLGPLLDDDFVLHFDRALKEGELHFELDQFGGFT